MPCLPGGWTLGSELDIATGMRLTVLPMVALMAGCAAGATPATTERVSNGKCEVADGRDWWDCCRSTGSTDMSCAPKIVHSELSLSCPQTPSECLKPVLGSWACRRTSDGYPTLVQIDASGIATGTYDNGTNWNKWCLTCDGKFDGIGKYQSTNYAHVGKYASAPSDGKLTFTVGWCAGRSLSECATAPEGGSSTVCERTQ